MSTVPASLHASPAAGYDSPFEMLTSCHERVERMLGLLERLSAHVARHGADTNARSAAGDLLRYFDLAAPHHHEDEERHVLPRLVASGHAALAERLRGEHRRMDQLWRDLRPLLVAVTEGHAPAAGLPDVEGYCALYRAHIVAEEAHAYPLTQPMLDATALHAMGEEMARRRGVR
ncbi:hemerythrin domain-containing protein [Sphaerotilus mobilis]|uniref:Hemerythrin HHE cation binding domain-containing protein n=1 Tax=Sphaerotilus mobilis TaxID=47994 RepID=A0A4Q7LQP0_9BURK|nr:hemerythrin domain-containing protein [Sphaerotilus mobilis]RZS57196.1 hemerythrin HHE cation binding domain-containing protein [Sphaerotilus mobilis]